MKTKTWLLAILIPAVISNAPAGQITNTAFIRTNLVLTLKQRVGPYTNEFNADELIVYCILPVPLTNDVFYRAFPANQSVDSHLFDESGREIAKTKEGLANSQPVRAPQSVDQAASLKGHSVPRPYELFRPDDMFAITNKGTYELEVRVRVWAQITNNSGPKYEMIGYFDKRIGTNAHFGVVTSEPVRVKVVKK
jgi:hypothetical protein